MSVRRRRTAFARQLLPCPLGFTCLSRATVMSRSRSRVSTILTSYIVVVVVVVVCGLTDHDNSRRQLMTKLATMASSYLLRAGSGFAADRGPPSACGTGLHFVLSMRAIVNVGLQHRSFTLLSPNGPSSEKASDPDFDCAWGEKMRIGTEEVGPYQRCRPGRRIGCFPLRSAVRRLWGVNALASSSLAF